jgi:2-dehydro-3-deoxyphosphogluconate aldolase / (4S)-4-hydroxy-2-oxoglutarate aldolase
MEAIRSERVIGIVRSTSGREAHKKAESLLAAGLAAVEVSLITPDALGVVRSLIEQRGHSAAVIGVGTVMDLDAARRSVLAGADFLVAPIFDPLVVAFARDERVGVIPGAGTVTEACAAHACGADLVKIFPASAWAPETVRHVLAAVPFLGLVPTGGVRLVDIPDWLRAGAVAVGMGSELTKGDDSEITDRVTGLRATVAGLGGNRSG